MESCRKLHWSRRGAGFSAQGSRGLMQSGAAVLGPGWPQAPVPPSPGKLGRWVLPGSKGSPSLSRASRGSRWQCRGSAPWEGKPASRRSFRIELAATGTREPSIIRIPGSHLSPSA